VAGVRLKAGMKSLARCRTLVVCGAGFAGQPHVEVDGLAEDLTRQRLRLDVMLRDAHQAEERDRDQDLP